MFFHVCICRHGILSNHRLSGKQLFPARSVKNAAPSNKRSGGFAFLFAARALFQGGGLFSFYAPLPVQIHTGVVGGAIFEPYPFFSRIF